jgi:hypothetical protein
MHIIGNQKTSVRIWHTKKNQPNSLALAFVYRCYHPDERRFVNRSRVNTMTFGPKVARPRPMCKTEKALRYQAHPRSRAKAAFADRIFLPVTAGLKRVEPSLVRMSSTYIDVHARVAVDLLRCVIPALF